MEAMAASDDTVTDESNAHYAELDSVCLARSAFEANLIASLLRSKGLRVYIKEEGDVFEMSTRLEYIPIWIVRPLIEAARQIVLESRLVGLDFKKAVDDAEAGWSSTPVCSDP